MLQSVLSLLLVMLATACGGVSGPEFGDHRAEARVLFIGNSLTYTHDVPGLVASLARQQGRSVSVASITGANMSLEDHWHNGVAGEIRRLRPTVVVLQQGPSSLPESRDNLVHWAGRFAEVIREVGAEPALYMVWPEAARRSAFPAVEQSYAAAAAAVGGRLLPAGSTWLEAWARDEQLALYGGDGFHPSYLGAFAAAMTIAAALFGADPATLPAVDGRPAAAELATLRAATAASLARW